jgi:hypothetical protein
VPLSEEELRLLEQMERALVAEDPKFASALRGTARRRDVRRRAIAAGAAFLVGIVVLMTGAVTANTVVGIVGFVVMLTSAVLGLASWRSHGDGVEEPAQEHELTTERFGLSVVDGGKKSKKQRAPKSRRSPGAGQQSMMQRFEERWRRRRDGNGGF